MLYTLYRLTGESCFQHIRGYRTFGEGRRARTWTVNVSGTRTSWFQQNDRPKTRLLAAPITIIDDHTPASSVRSA